MEEKPELSHIQDARTSSDDSTEVSTNLLSQLQPAMPSNSPSIDSNKSVLNDLTTHGKVTMQGKNVSFLAKDFIEQLKLGASTNVSSTRSSVSSTHRSLSDIPDINPGLIDRLEKECITLTESVDAVLLELTNRLHTISAISVANTQACSERVHEISSHADGAVHTMYSLIAHMEELDEAVKPIHALATKITSLKDIVMMLENYIH